ncbi:MAG TPA: PEP-utilizing enzyme [Solirubrobacteraceae bacterium]|jgi:pyruvate,water dikinase|nr:PEP-utilizing enzyme [Solirubrobacteraceae bacterium]
MQVNPLHYEATDPDVLWSPGNVSEAIPGVSTALNWTFIDDAIETAARRAFHSLGVLSNAELRPGGRAEERFMVCFYGRTVANIEAMRMIGDRMPGTSANAVEEQLFGVVRPEAVNHPSYARLPVVAALMPRTVATLRARQLALRAEIERWWRAAVLDPPADAAEARALLRDAQERYTRAFELGTIASMLAQALYDQVVLLAGAAGRAGLQHRLVTGYADVLETRLLKDIAAFALGRIDLPSFLLRHGFHGPDEGQLVSQVWRERPEPLHALAKRYASLPADRDPDTAAARQGAIRLEAERELLTALGRFRAPGARLTLSIARALIPQREVGKANYTQCLDGARIAARVLGGQFDDPDQVFGLTYQELTADRLPRDAEGLAAERQALRDDYLTSELPEKWTGPPARIPLDGAPASQSNGHAPISGEGVGGGSVTARVRIVLDPAAEELEPGEILVCRSTDPGWVSLFQLAGGVAVDMGGTMSHAAIVARELGIPCVTCTVDGTRRLQTGDLVRLDGDNGRIEVL